MRNALLILGVIIIAGLSYSCASIIGKGSPETLNVRSAPEQADIVIIDEKGTKIFSGKTPTTVSLEKKRGFFRGKKYTVKISKTGYKEQNITVDTVVNGWYIGGNLVFGGLIGWLIVDPATGAMWSLDTNEINVTLEEMKQSKEKEIYKLKIVLLDDVPESLRGKMVKISN
jgi:hypothetical protein